MPSRTPVNEQQVLAVVEEVGSGREAARRLGIHENTVYAVLKRHRGVCVRCGRQVEFGRKHCADCLAELREDIRQKRRQRLRLGVCQQCDKPVEPPSKSLCAHHRLERIESNARYALRQRAARGTPEDGVPDQRQRERALRQNYGEAGVIVWRKHNGRCVVCDVPHRLKAVCVHHIDSNPENNTEANLTLLCFRCHKLTHLLVEHNTLPKMLDWLRSTYSELPW